MKSILDKLHKDHINFIKLLKFLEEQLHLLEQYKYPDLAATLDAVRYMKEYPDHIHHPLEDVLFKYFLGHHENAHDEIMDLLHEHDEMPLLTEKLSSILKGALADMPQKRKELCSYLKKYIAIQKEHMNRENANIYPILNSMLNEKDWKNIDSELAQIEDPLFGEKVEKSYQGLFQQIIS